MKKTPTLFVRDPENMAQVLPDVNPECQWVIDGEGIATRKYDGTCLLLDGSGWYARREIKPGKSVPPDYKPIETDPNTGKIVGWEPIQQSAFFRYWQQAFEADPRHEGVRGGFQFGTYELIGPKVNGNPEGLIDHLLILHDDAERLLDVPRDFAGLAAWMAGTDFEGIVWHHPDGRMAKLKKRDFPSPR